MNSTLTEAEPSPVFVDTTGRRGRRLRGLGWVAGVVCVGFAAAMISGLLGAQSRAPAYKVPDSAPTAPPGQYVDAPLPSPPGKAERGKDRSPDPSSRPATTVTAEPPVPATTEPQATGTATTRSGNAATPTATASPAVTTPYTPQSPTATAPTAHPPATTTPTPRPTVTASATTSVPTAVPNSIP